MAAPPNKSLQNLAGKWTMSTRLTTSISGVLSIQNIPTLLRKIIVHAPVYLAITQPDAEHISIKQSTTAGIPALDEEWTLDWQWRENKDRVMGLTKGRARWIPAGEVDGVVEEAFLKDGGWEELTGGEASLIQAEVVGVDGKWRSSQLWGFQVVEGERRWVRRTVVLDEGGSGDREEVRIVYDWDG